MSLTQIGNDVLVVDQYSVRTLSKSRAWHASEEKPWELRLHGAADPITISEADKEEAIRLFPLRRNTMTDNLWDSRLPNIQEMRERGPITVFFHNDQPIDVALHGLLHLRVLRDGVTVRAQYAVAVVDHPGVPLSAFIEHLRRVFPVNFHVLGQEEVPQPAPSVAAPRPYPYGGAPTPMLD